MLITRNWATRSGSSSMLILPTFTFPWFSWAKLTPQWGNILQVGRTSWPRNPPCLLGGQVQNFLLKIVLVIVKTAMRNHPF